VTKDGSGDNGSLHSNKECEQTVYPQRPWGVSSLEEDQRELSSRRR
jgi:hypothetical protein